MTAHQNKLPMLQLRNYVSSHSKVLKRAVRQQQKAGRLPAIFKQHTQGLNGIESGSISSLHDMSFFGDGSRVASGSGSLATLASPSHDQSPVNADDTLADFQRNIELNKQLIKRQIERNIKSKRREKVSSLTKLNPYSMERQSQLNTQAGRRQPQRRKIHTQTDHDEPSINGSLFGNLQHLLHDRIAELALTGGSGKVVNIGQEFKRAAGTIYRPGGRSSLEELRALVNPELGSISRFQSLKPQEQREFPFDEEMNKLKNYANRSSASLEKYTENRKLMVDLTLCR